MKLEELARKSSDAARISVVRLDPPPIAEPTPRRFATPALVGFAGLLMLLGVGALVLLNNDNNDGEITAAATPEIPRLGFPAFDSWEVSGAYNLGELAAEQGVTGVMTFDYYGELETDDPYGNGDLLIATFVDGGDEISLSEGSVRSVELRGVTAQVVNTQQQGLSEAATAFEWDEPNPDPSGPALRLFVASKSLDETELIAVAEAMSIDVDAGTAVPADGNLKLVASENATPFDSFRPQGDGYLVAYERFSDEQPDSLVITTRVGDLRSERSALEWWGATTEDITVNGRPGFTASLDEILGDPADGESEFVSRTVVWTPSSGVVANLVYFGNNAELDVVEVASAAVELDDDTWLAYQQRAAAVSMNSADFSIVYLEGDGTVNGEAYAFVLGLQADQLCFDLATDSGGTGSCGGGSGQVNDPTEARVIDNGFGDTIASVVIAAGSDVDEIVASETYTVHETTTDDGQRFFVAIGSSEVQPTFDVIVDGEVVDSLEAGAEGIAVATEDDALDVAANPSAQAAGIADLDVIANFGDDRVPVALGFKGSDLCIVTFGEAVGAGCSPANDIVVFRSVQLADGTERTHVVLTTGTLPGCIDPASGTSMDGSVPWAGSFEADNTYFVAAIDGVAEGLQAQLTTTSGEAVSVDLPDIDGNAAWPEGICP